MLALENVMDEALPADRSGGLADALDTLRHALAAPLPAAGLKLEFVGRRLATPFVGETFAARIEGANADLAGAGRLLDLLSPLARIAGEAPEETAIAGLSLIARVALVSCPFPALSAGAEVPR